MQLDWLWPPKQICWALKRFETVLTDLRGGINNVCPRPFKSTLKERLSRQGRCVVRQFHKLVALAL